MEIKKLSLYLDKEEKQRFQEKGISEDEMKMVEHGFLVQKRIDQGKTLGDTNPENLPYIILLKKRNNLREGNPNVFDRVIYYYAKDKELAQKKLLYAFQEIFNGRDANSVQNLGFATEKNLKFVSSLTAKKKEEKVEKKKKEENDNDKKRDYRSNS